MLNMELHVVTENTLDTVCQLSHLHHYSIVVLCSHGFRS